MSVEMHAKYVIVEPAHLPGFPVPVLLPMCLEHKLAAALGRPVSAGFVRRDPTAEYGVATFGFSTGLNLPPAAADARLIARWFGEVLHEPAKTLSPKGA